MPSHEAEAIVLRHYPLSEADRIVVFVTREFGKVRAVGQGVKRPRSRLVGSLEPMNHVRVDFYAKEGSDLWRIRQCETLHSYLGRNPSLERLYGYQYLAELTQELVEENHSNPPVFRLLLAVLNAGEALGMGEALARYFEIWILRLSGLLPDYGYCSDCKKCVKDSGFYAWIEAGQGRCAACARGRGVIIRAAAGQALRRILQLSPEQFSAKALPPTAACDLERLTQRLLELHLEKHLKSYAALRSHFQRT